MCRRHRFGTIATSRFIFVCAMLSEVSSELSEARWYRSKSFGNSTKPHHRPFYLFRPSQELSILTRTGLFGLPSPARRAYSAFLNAQVNVDQQSPQSPLRLPSDLYQTFTAHSYATPCHYSISTFNLPFLTRGD